MGAGQPVTTLERLFVVAMRSRSPVIAGPMERPAVDRDREVAALFDAHYTPMCRLAFVILGDGAVAEEIVMEAMLKTFTGWGRIRDPQRADVYLRRTVVNLCRSRIRRKAIEARIGLAPARPDPQTGARRPGSDRQDEWDPDVHERGRLVSQAVRSLPPRQRACVVLRYYEDLPEARIAEILDCSTGTVKSQLSKARSKLQRELSDSLVEGST
jgi:RNA polymerase sigma-70 factor (sigma-E family)